jgi:hypothetical protein
LEIQNINNELTITIPNGIVVIVEIQRFLDYLRFKSIVNKSQATEEDIEQIAEEINESWWVKNKTTFVK